MFVPINELNAKTFQLLYNITFCSIVENICTLDFKLNVIIAMHRWDVIDVPETNK